jgi:hypothetical protein
MPPDTNTVRDRAPRMRADAVGKGRMLTLGTSDNKRDAAWKTADLIDSLEADLGGADRLSTAERRLVRHAALSAAMIEDLATRWLEGEPIDPTVFAALCTNERRTYETCGLRRAPRDVTNDLQSYLAAKSATADPAAAAGDLAGADARPQGTRQP